VVEERRILSQQGKVVLGKLAQHRLDFRRVGRAGCALTLPEARLRTQVPGQEIWGAVVRRLAGVPAPGGTPAASTETPALLRQLARDDFALVRENPPLLFHNDLTATVPRYYWSEDVGYALWLRLAHLAREDALVRPSHANG